MPRQKSKASGRQPAPVALLIKDHRKFQKLCKQFEKANEDEKQTIIQEACAELRVHAQLEEEVFYPAVAKALGEDGQDLLAEARVEHDVAKNLIQKLERSSKASDEDADALFTVLGEYVGHHIEEEETELFKKLRRAKIDFEALANAMRQRQMELREELGLGDDASSQKTKEAREHRRSS